MAKKQIAGQERPYDYFEFTELILRLAKEQGHDLENENGLEYFNADSEGWDDKKKQRIYKTLTSPEFDIVSETAYGSNEGIYTSFYVRHYDGEQRRYVREDLATAKTCSRSDEQYMAMHAMAARFETLAMAYVDQHQDEFNWTGYGVTGTKEGNYFGGWYCYKPENAEARAQELLQHGADTVTVTNYKTRKVKTYTL